jgi:selenocysteine-specific elongation factor
VIDPYSDHPIIEQVRLGGFTPPSLDGLDRSVRRELVRRGHLVDVDGVVFHPATVEEAERRAARLLELEPAGFTVAAFRDATGASRKFALPLLAELDARGVTRRRDDVRIAGPRLPV